MKPDVDDAEVVAVNFMLSLSKTISNYRDIDGVGHKTRLQQISLRQAQIDR